MESSPEAVLAGAATVSLKPTGALPMIGFVRRQTCAVGMGLPLQATAVVIESGGVRVVLCGVDTIALTVAQSDRVRGRIARDLSTDPANVLLNWNHTHNAPPAGGELLRRSGLLAVSSDPAVDRYGDELEDRLVHASVRAATALEPAAATWGVGSADLSVNRRERDDLGRIVHGWRVDGIVDQQVTVLQLQRPDSSPIATVVGYGCHPVAVGMDFPGYSSDYPGAVRESLRREAGGEVIFLQGSAGNVLPRVSFGEDEQEAQRMGERIAVEAAHAIADRPAWPTELVRVGDASLIPMRLLRRKPVDPTPLELRVSHRTATFPYQDPPSLEQLTDLAESYDRELDEAVARDAGPAERYGIEYHRKWAHVILDDVRGGELPSSVEAPMSAIRIGEGAIVTAPGELFTELGWAIKTRSPALPTLVAGYTNGAVGYLPTPEAYVEGGYEPAYSNRSYGTHATVAPACAAMVVETAVRMLEELFPERERFAGTDWLSTADPLPVPAPLVPVRPADVADDSPAVVEAPG